LQVPHRIASVAAVDRGSTYIGSGPWYNAKSQLIASNVADLHGDQQRDRNNIQRATALDARGKEIPGNEHDILTAGDLLEITDGTTPDRPTDPWLRNPVCRHAEG